MRKFAKVVLNTLAASAILTAVGCDFMSDPVDPWDHGGHGGHNGGGCGGDTIIVDTLDGGGWDDGGWDDGGWDDGGWDTTWNDSIFPRGKRP